MQKYELLSTRHAKYLLHVHLVFTTKYRKKIFTKEHINFMNSTFSQVCNNFDSSLVEFDGESDHVHLLINYPPRVSIASLVNSLKGVSSRYLRKHYPSLTKHYFKEAVIWSRSYFAASCGGAPIEILKQYIEQQNTPD